MLKEVQTSLNYLYELFEYHARQTPYSIAVVCGQKHITYQQLNDQSNILANYCLNNGCLSGKNIGVSMNLSIEMIISVLAIHKMGCTSIAIDPELPLETRKSILEEASPITIFTKKQFLTDELDQSIPYVCIDTIFDIIEKKNYNKPVIPHNPLIPAYILYTSGSTNKPKGIVISHKASIDRFFAMINEFRLDSKDVFLMKLNISYRELYIPLMIGAKLVICKSGGVKDPRYLNNLIKEQMISVIHLVPSVLKTMMSIDSFNECKSLKKVFCSGEALDFNLKQDFLNKSEASLYNLWGASETHVITYFNCSKTNSSNPVPIGKPFGDAKVLVLNDELAPVKKGDKGQLCVKSKGLANGYLNQPDLTNKKFIRNPFGNSTDDKLYLTGDVGRYMDDGNLEYIGRIDRQVKIRGNRVELEEIEYCCNLYQNVKESAVICIDNNFNSKKIIAFVTLKSPGSQEPIRSFLKNKLPGYKMPSSVFILDKMPLNNTTYKIDYRKLETIAYELLKCKQDSKVSSIAPQNAIQETIANIWKEVLDVPAVSISDNFIDIGGHSLQLIQVVCDIEEKLHVEVSIQHLMEDTLEELSKHCSDLLLATK